MYYVMTFVSIFISLVLPSANGNVWVPVLTRQAFIASVHSLAFQSDVGITTYAVGGCPFRAGGGVAMSRLELECVLARRRSYIQHTHAIDAGARCLVGAMPSTPPSLHHSIPPSPAPSSCRLHTLSIRRSQSHVILSCSFAAKDE